MEERKCNSGSAQNVQLPATKLEYNVIHVIGLTVDPDLKIYNYVLRPDEYTLK